MKIFSNALFCKLLSTLVCIFTMVLSLNVHANGDMSDQEEGFQFGERSVFSDRAVEARIKADGAVCLQGQPCAGATGGAQVQVAEAPAAARTAEEIYNSKCMSCHVAGVAGAPLFGDVAAWTARVDEKGLDMLVTNAIKGINAMPAMGLCMDCSEEDIRVTVEYMVNAAK